MKYFGTSCPYVSRSCVDGFGALYKCGSCHWHTTDYDYHKRIVIFYDSPSQVNRTNSRYAMYPHNTGYVVFVDVNKLLDKENNRELHDKVTSEVARGMFHEFYIIPQNRKLRQELRKFLHDSSGKPIHIQLFSKWVNAVDRHSQLK